jgi:RNA polymerase sigma factor for flagellar operon FliA
VSRRSDSESTEQLAHLFDIVEQEVSRLTTRLPRHAFERDELVSCVFVGLCEARVRFRSEYGVPLGAYARLRIRGALLDGLRSTLGVVRRRQFERIRMAAQSPDDRFGIEFRLQALKRAVAEQHHGARKVSTPEAQLLEQETKQRVRCAVERLEPKHRELMRALFGIDGEMETGEAVAHRMGRHRSSVCRQKHKALGLLRADLAESPSRASVLVEPRSARRGHAGRRIPSKTLRLRVSSPRIKRG